MYLGGRVTVTLDKSCHRQAAAGQLQIKMTGFLYRGCITDSARFNLTDPLFAALKVLDPQGILMKSVPSIAPLASHFTNLVPESDVNISDSEWCLLRNTTLVFGSLG
ncbi:hypothetical protein Hamer_G010164 [Homarus americanus]|uniref:Uncharacterized protein n=1 Tax=Homarus americanus TaxID=6706 RepID=A0A8J5K4G1_HOMAM|nr:hypothetical protein Hamer_G010164 [Homarus americanus]